MNKNVIIVGAIAVGLYLMSQGKKSTMAVVKKKAPQRLKRKYPRPHFTPIIKRVIAKKKAINNKPKIKRVIAKKKAIYNKPKIKRVIAKKKAIYNKPKIKRVIAKKKAIYNKPKIRKATAKKIMAPKLTKPQKKKMNKAFHVPIKRQRFWLRPKPKRR